jgi:hypothetical protein
MNKKLAIETISFALLIVVFPVTSAGTDNDNKAVWVLGLVALIVGGVLPVWTRFMDHSTDKPTDMGMEHDERIS